MEKKTIITLLTTLAGVGAAKEGLAQTNSDAAMLKAQKEQAIEIKVQPQKLSAREERSELGMIAPSVIDNTLQNYALNPKGRRDDFEAHMEKAGFEVEKRKGGFDVSKGEKSWTITTDGDVYPGNLSGRIAKEKSGGNGKGGGGIGGGR